MFRCEYASRVVLPALRKAIAVEFVQSGKKKNEVAKILGVTPAAVSQYLSGKRARIQLTDDEIEMVKNLVRRGLTQEGICKICSSVTRRVRGC